MFKSNSVLVMKRLGEDLTQIEEECVTKLCEDQLICVFHTKQILEKSCTPTKLSACTNVLIGLHI